MELKRSIFPFDRLQRDIGKVNLLVKVILNFVPDTVTFVLKNCLSLLKVFSCWSQKIQVFFLFVEDPECEIKTLTCSDRLQTSSETGFFFH